MLPSKLNIEKIQSIDVFSALGREWGALLSLSNESTFFLKWDWMFTWWEHFGSKEGLFILLIKKPSGELLGIAPFYINTKWQGLPIKALSYIGSDPISSEYLDIICTYENQKKISTIIANEIIQSYQGKIEITFNHYLPNSTVQLLIEQLKTAYWQKTSLSGIRHFAKLPPQKSDFEQQCDKSLLKRLLRHKRKLMNTLQGDFIHFNQAKNVDEGLHILTELHIKRWTEQGKPGAFVSDKFKRFHQQFCHRAAEKNWLQLWVLKSGDIAVAAIYAIEFNNSCYFYQSGINTQFKPNLSPCFLSHFLLMEKCIDKNIAVYDFMKSKSKTSYKTNLSNASCNMYHTTLLNKSCLNLIEMLKFVLIKKLKSLTQWIKPKGFK